MAPAVLPACHLRQGATMSLTTGTSQPEKVPGRISVWCQPRPRDPILTLRVQRVREVEQQPGEQQEGGQPRGGLGAVQAAQLGQDPARVCEDDLT